MRFNEPNEKIIKLAAKLNDRSVTIGGAKVEGGTDEGKEVIVGFVREMRVNDVDGMMAYWEAQLIVVLVGVKGNQSRNI